MNESFGSRLSRIRREKNFTQDDIAKKLNISYQAVSKWENDITNPDISILLELSEMLGVSLNTLLGKKEEVLYEPKEKKDIDRLVLKIIVNDKDDKVNVNIPVKVIQACLSAGISVPGTSKTKDIDWEEIYKMIESGIIGNLVEIEGSDGEQVIIRVE